MNPKDVRFLRNTAGEVNLHFGDSDPEFPIGIEVKTIQGPDEGCCILALSSPWLKSNAVKVSNGPGCLSYFTGHHQNDLQSAFEQVKKRLDASDEIQPTDLYEHGFVLIHDREAQFKLSFDTGHEAFTERTADELIRMELHAQIVGFTGAGGSSPQWQNLDPLRVSVRIKGPLPIWPKAFAIDFGTTNTSAAFMAGNPPEPRVFPFLNAPDSIPTLISYDSIGEVPRYRIGFAAETHEVEGSAQRVVRGIKRKLGEASKDTRNLTVLLDKDVTGKRLVDEVLLDYLTAYVKQIQGFLVHRLRMVHATYPPDFSPRGSQAMRDVYGRLGIRKGPLLEIDEASAAALYYLWKRLEESQFNLTAYRSIFGEVHNMLVFDMGGGTTDIAMITAETRPNAAGGRKGETIHFKVHNAITELIGGENLTREVFKAIKCRLAFALAEHFKGDIPKDLRDKQNIAKALMDIYEGREAFLEQLTEPAEDFSYPKRLQEKADIVLPTAWKTLEKDPNATVFDEERARRAFNELWHVAEQVKKELNDKGTVQILENRLYRFADAVAHIDLHPVLENIKLDREIDLYQRSRNLIRKAVRRCREVATDHDGAVRPIHSIQLVGNSCRIDLIRSTIIEEFADDVREIEDLIEYSSEHSKTSVALGACLAAHINHYGGFKHLRFSFEGIGKELGYEIGEWNRFNRHFEPHFFPTDLLHQHASKLIDDEGISRLDIYRRRPGAPSEAPTYLGCFIFEERGKRNPSLKKVPEGKIRLVLVSRTSLIAIRGQDVYNFGKPRDPGIDDPFSGKH